MAHDPSSAGAACSPGAEQERVFSAVNAAFGSLGRACMALDRDFRVRYASDVFDTLLGPGTAARLRGSPVEALLGTEMFGPDGPLRQSLLAGEKREGWRAVLQAEGAEARLMSVSAAPLQRDRYGVCDPEAQYLVVLRPADEATIEASGPIGGFGLIARSSAMARVFRLIDTLQHSESTVLITGESGTGKEVTARIIHAHSPAQGRPVRRRERRRSARRAARERALRPRPRRVHRRGARSGGPLRGGQRRHPLPRRGGGRAPCTCR